MKITLYYSLFAVILDAVAGDPRWLPHPVRWMGALIAWCEKVLYPRKRSGIREMVGGCITVIVVISVTAVLIYYFLKVCRAVHPIVEVCGGVLIGFYCVAARSLLSETGKIYKLLSGGKYYEARKAVAMIVGRDTHSLDTTGISRATIETAAESIVDGIVSPLFYLTFGGPVVALVFKAVSTMDSMIGYRNERYRFFGTCAARCDDILNFIPARITAFILFPAAALFTGRHPLNIFKAANADRKKHPSPNSAHGEAAMAGALGIQLGGMSTYGGVPSEKPVLNSKGRKPVCRDIASANGLVIVVTIVAAAVFIGLRLLLSYLFRV